MKTIFIILSLLVISSYTSGQNTDNFSTLQQSLDSATATIRRAFEQGDIELIAQLHSPNIEKYFGGNNVVMGRENLKKGLEDWLKNSKVEFIESTVFIGETAIQTVIFGIKTTPKNGGKPTIGRGCSMVIYVQDKDSPTGWLTLREMAQEAPPKEK